MSLPVKLILCPLSRAEVNNVELSTGKNEMPWDSSSFKASCDVDSAEERVAVRLR
jgi:hypothetical protein